MTKEPQRFVAVERGSTGIGIYDTRESPAVLVVEVMHDFAVGFYKRTMTRATNLCGLFNRFDTFEIDKGEFL